MLLTLANVLDIPLRERNFLLLAAGYAPVYGETSLDDPRMTQVRAAVEIILKSNEPRSALAHDRHWNVVMANAAFVRFLTIVFGKEPAGLIPLRVSTSPRLNVLHLIFDPNGLRRVIVNWEAIAKSLLNEAYRRLAWARDDTLKKLIAEILSYPGVPARWREPDLEAPHDLILPMELRIDGRIGGCSAPSRPSRRRTTLRSRNCISKWSIRPTPRLSRYCSRTKSSWKQNSSGFASDATKSRGTRFFTTATSTQYD
jgi:hypothetical protein